MSTPIAAMPRSSISHSIASSLQPGKCIVPAESVFRYAASLLARASQPEFIATSEPRLILPCRRS